MVFKFRTRVYYYDTDAAGVVHNVAYLRMIEQARTEMAEAWGWRLSDMARSGLVPVVARTEIEYVKPARLADELEIWGRVSEVERVRFYLEFEVWRPGDGVLIARCRQVMVTVQLPGGRPQPVPEFWRERVG
ncbi:MAG: acyl-CoA thioesterase [Methylacidiphilales bacterium]|nr:acyl-CoA thioesterase [Candidatus Methylacidiphilales bacterium]MDW8350154.1 thioesterase family protein [Verrucomicrobiae bacterium]